MTHRQMRRDLYRRLDGPVPVGRTAPCGLRRGVAGFGGLKPRWCAILSPPRSRPCASSRPVSCYGEKPRNPASAAALRVSRSRVSSAARVLAGSACRTARTISPGSSSSSRPSRAHTAHSFSQYRPSDMRAFPGSSSATVGVTTSCPPAISHRPETKRRQVGRPSSSVSAVASAGCIGLRPFPMSASRALPGLRVFPSA